MKLILNFVFRESLYTVLLAFRFVMGSDRRKPLQLKPKLPDISNFMKLRKTCFLFRVTLEGRRGKILDLLTVRVQPLSIIALTQFYAPPLRSFLFQDFQLAHTLEEFERILGIPMKGRIPYARIGQVPKV